jgi:hypothetical protein
MFSWAILLEFPLKVAGLEVVCIVGLPSPVDLVMVRRVCDDSDSLRVCNTPDGSVGGCHGDQRAPITAFEPVKRHATQIWLLLASQTTKEMMALI